MNVISHTLIRRVFLVLLATALAGLAVPNIVLGHAELVTATPPDKATVTQPVTEISGTYSASMTTPGSSIIVKDASGTTVATGTLDPAKDTRMVATSSTPLANGTYTVAWTSIATDGDLLRGTWAFTVAIAASPSPRADANATSSAATSVAPTTVTSPVASPAPTGSTDPASGGNGDVVIPIIVALIVLGAGAAYLLRRRGRAAGQP